MDSCDRISLLDPSKTIMLGLYKFIDLSNSSRVQAFIVPLRSSGTPEGSSPGIRSLSRLSLCIFAAKYQSCQP